MSQYSENNGNDRNDGRQERKTLHGEILYPEGQAASDSGTGYRRVYRTTGGMWTFAPMDNGGCLASFITTLLFLFCLGQYGLLAAIGFFVFHLIGSIMGSVHSARQLVRGLPYSVWAWRTGNWIISFLVTVWLAGGLS